MDDLTTRLQKQAERGTYIPDGPELMRDVITELAALSCKNSQLLSTNYDLHKERDRQIDEIEFLRSRLAAHEYIPTPEERRKQEALAKEIAAEVIADETELKRLRLEIESLRSRLAELQTCPNCGLKYTGCEGEDIHARLVEAEQARDSAFETWKKFHQDTLAAFIKNEHEPLKARLAEALEARQRMEQKAAQDDADWIAARSRLAEVERLLQEVYDGRQSLMSVGLVYRIGHTLNHRPADSATHRENDSHD